MSYKEYKVRVFKNGDKEWRLDGQLHREDGPAVEFANGNKEWYLNGEEYSEQEFNQRMNKDCIDGKVVEINGKRYQLKEIQ